MSEKVTTEELLERIEVLEKWTDRFESDARIKHRYWQDQRKNINIRMVAILKHFGVRFKYRDEYPEFEIVKIDKSETP